MTVPWRRVFLVLCLPLAVPLLAQDEVAPQARSHNAIPAAGRRYTERMTFEDRMQWAARAALSPKRFAGNAVSSALSTWTNSPEEYGPHWDGYGKRVGLRLTTGATGLVMEAAVGALWNENPRYVPARERPIGARIGNVLKHVVMSKNFEGKFVPAYARHISTVSNNFLTNAWRPDSHATVGRAVTRIQLSFLDRALANAITEFWPEVAKVVHLKRR